MAEDFKNRQVIALLKNSTAKYLLLFGAVTLWALPTAYFQVFTTFMPYDDEGYLMITVKQYLAGNTLYDQVYTQYGAVYYFFQWLLHQAFDLPVTHNITRLTTLFFWILTVLFCGIFTSRLTKSALAGAAAYVSTFFILFRTTFEAGHPQELCGFFLICGLMLLTGKNEGNVFHTKLFFLGLTLALLFLTKINLGIFFGLALAISFVALSPKSIFQRFLLPALIFAAMLLPFILFRKYLALGWLRLCISVSICLTAIFLTSSWKMKETQIYFKNYLICAAGFLLSITIVVLIVFLQGTSPAAFFNGIFLQHLKFGDNFFQPAPIQRFAPFWAIFALATALLIFFLKDEKADLTAKSVGALKLFFGAVVTVVTVLDHFNFVNVYLLVSFATPFLWLILLNQHLRPESEKTILPRLVLVVTAVLQPLQMFPIAGTQMNYGAFLIAVVGIICLRDALLELKILLPETSVKQYWQRLIVGVLILTFVKFAVDFTNTVHANYRSQVPLSFSGAERVRLPEEDFALYNFLVENIKANCDDFVSIPGVYSLNFWTHIEPPTTFNATALLTLLDDAQKDAIIEKMQAAQRGCVVYNSLMTVGGLRNKTPEDFAFSRFFLENYNQSIGWRNDRILFSPNRRLNLTYYARTSDSASKELEFYLPATMKDAANVAEIQIYNWQNKRILARLDNSQVVYTDINESGLTQKQGVVRLPEQSPELVVGENNSLLRLLDSEGKILASLPFIFDQTK